MIVVDSIAYMVIVGVLVTLILSGFYFFFGVGDDEDDL